MTLGMQDCKPTTTPVSAGSKLIKATEQDECVDQRQYQSALGNLMYLVVSTRPDISLPQGHKDLGILYSKAELDSCIGYADADWAGDEDDQKSISGYIFLLSGGAISWKSQKQ